MLEYPASVFINEFSNSESTIVGFDGLDGPGITDAFDSQALMTFLQTLSFGVGWQLLSNKVKGIFQERLCLFFSSLNAVIEITELVFY